MRFAGSDTEGVQRGEITVAFRRWTSALVRPGRVYRTNAGRLRIDTVAEIDPAAIADADARRAGRESAHAARDALVGDPARPVYRVAFGRVTEPDPRAALAAAATLG